MTANINLENVKKNIKNTSTKNSDIWLALAYLSNVILSITAERKPLPSVSTALVLSLGIGLLEAAAMYLGSGVFISMMGIPTVSNTSLKQKFLFTFYKLSCTFVYLFFSQKYFFDKLVSCENTISILMDVSCRLHPCAFQQRIFLSLEHLVLQQLYFILPSKAFSVVLRIQGPLYYV